MVNVQYEDQEINLPLIIVKSTDKAVLFGLQWFDHIKLNWKKVCCMQGSVSEVLEKHRSSRGRIGYAEGNHGQDVCRERTTT